MNTSEILKDWISRRLAGSVMTSCGYADIPAKPFDVLKYVVRETLSRESDFYFVQIGANDGTMADPLSDLIVRHGLKGLLVEPLPDFFQKLWRSTRAAKGCRLNAVPSENGTVKPCCIESDPMASPRMGPRPCKFPALKSVRSQIRGREPRSVRGRSDGAMLDPCQPFERARYSKGHVTPDRYRGIRLPDREDGH